ncbi:MAG: Gfo/Idh/MocA family oxidoreductase [Bacteroidota bacterium]|nr:Gfo/Idh/MocA family oxidoreductase [Bacteroidota bacterium]
MKKFAIIGCGRIAEKHAENIARIGKLVAVADLRHERAKALAGQYKANAYYSIEDVLTSEKDLDIVVICTPNGFHAEHIIKTLQAGKHVICESPMCLTKAAAWQIIETEKFCRRTLYVVKPARYTPVLQQLKNIVSNNDLGKLYSFHLNCIWNRPDSYYTDWHGKLFPDGGTLYTQFTNYIDILLWLFGGVKEVKGFKANMAHQQSIEFEDTGAAALQMENDMVGSLHWSVNSFQKNHEIAVTLVAEKGTIKIGGEYLNELQYCVTETNLKLTPSDNTHNNGPGTSTTNLDRMYNHLSKILGNNDNSFTDAFDGLRTVETIEKIYKAVSSN